MNAFPRRLAALATLLAVTLPAQDGGKPPQPESGQDPAHASEWPELKDTVKDRVRSLAGQFRKPKEKLWAPAQRDLIKIGAGVAPILIPLVSDKADNINAQLFGVLDEVLDPTHTALLVREAERHSVEWRRYLMRKLARFGDPLAMPVLEKAATDKDPEVAFHSSLGLLAQKQKAGLEAVLVAARERWSEVAPDIERALPQARSKEVSMWVLERIGQARPVDQMAGLRLLRHVMVKDQCVVLKAYLDSQEFQVKREAVNCARVMHGEPPLEKLSTFQVIEMAQQWKSKL